MGRAWRLTVSGRAACCDGLGVLQGVSLGRGAKCCQRLLSESGAAAGRVWRFCRQSMSSSNMCMPAACAKGLNVRPLRIVVAVFGGASALADAGSNKQRNTGYLKADAKAL